MTNLTEQWKKGKLPEGDYYIKRRNGFLPYDNIDSYGVWRNSIDEDIIEVLAEVPSFEEWQEKSEENNKLKKLLKKHRDIFARTLALCIDLNFSEKQKNQFSDDIAEIDQVLGEE